MGGARKANTEVKELLSFPVHIVLWRIYEVSFSCQEPNQLFYVNMFLFLIPTK